MRVHIISDMEGVAGIVNGDQVNGSDPKPLFEEGRRLYTEEINAAIRGEKAAGATEIVVMDCHGADGGYTFNSLVPDLLDPACEYVVQQEWTEYTEFLEQGCGLGARSARNVAPLRARELIEEGARKALADVSAVRPYDPGRPCEIRVEYKTTMAVDTLRRVPDVEIVGPREVVVRADDWWTAWQRFFFFDS